MSDRFITNDVSDRWNHYRNIMGVPTRRRIFCGIGWIATVLCLILIAFIFLSVKSSDNSEKKAITEPIPKENVLQLFESFPSAVDVSADPCMDFYNFSCSLWAHNNPAPSYGSQVTTFSVLQDAVNEKTKTIFVNSKAGPDLPQVVNNALLFYNVCVEQTGAGNYSIQLLHQFFNQIGGWPILDDSQWNEALFDWADVSAFLIKHLDLHPIIGVATTDYKITGGRDVIYLCSSSVLEDEETVLSNPYTEMMFISILTVLKGGNLSPDFYYKFQEFKAVEAKWRKHFSYKKEAVDPMYMSIGELSIKIPDIGWLNYLQSITNDSLLEVNACLTLNDTVGISSINYLSRIASILNSNMFSKRELANLFGWFIVKDIWIMIPGVLDIYAQYSQYLAEDLKELTMQQCYTLVQDIFYPSVDYLFIKKFSHSEIESSRVLTRYLKSAFKDIVRKSYWLDNISKSSILYKLDNMHHVLGYLDYFNDKTKFDEVFENYPSMKHTPLEYYFETQQYDVKKRFVALKVPVSYSKWVLPRSVTHASAYYIVSKNTLVYPLSLHNPPFFYLNGPWYLNFGAIGAVIGHEMMHGFDYFDSKGNKFNVTWLSKPMKEFYQILAECFKHQYDSFDRTGHYKNNGTCTLRENIVDNEGLHIAYDAYKKHVKDFGGEQSYQTLPNYSPDQMFFIAFASVWCSEMDPSFEVKNQDGSHSFPEVRVNNVVSNSRYFAEVFNCPEGSPMNPTKKCSLW